MINTDTEKAPGKARQKPVAVVTGGGTGIGAACCRALGRNGYNVGIHYRSSSEPARKVLEDIGGQGFLIQTDLEDPGQIDGMLRQIKDTAGRLDVLVNNAGVCINDFMNTMKLDAFDDQRAIVRGVWYLTKRVVRVFMLRQSCGKIINISSVVGHTGNAGQIPYTMEKAALDAMTKSLAKELGERNILVNSVAPGFIDTEMTCELPEDARQRILDSVPLGRMGTPGEVAEVVEFLARGGSYITGSVIHVNGGMYGG